MKINELRELIKKHKREELEYLVAELYKILTKAQKENNDIDALLTKPSKDIAGKTNGKNKERSFDEVKKEALAFVDHAREGFYLFPNRIVSKKDRSKWRFVVKRLFKEISNAAENKDNALEASEVLGKVYELLCYSCGYTTFTAYDTFESVGIAQSDFFNRVLILSEKVKEKEQFIEIGIKLIVNNYLNRYTLYSELMEILIRYLPIPDLKYTAIKIARKVLEDVKNKNEVKKGDSLSEYHKKEMINNLGEFIFRCYAHLYEFDNATEAFKQIHFEKDEEVKLYILISLLFEFEQKELILKEIEMAMKNGMKIRSRLTDLKKHIKDFDKLPDYL